MLLVKTPTSQATSLALHHMHATGFHIPGKGKSDYSIVCNFSEKINSTLSLKENLREE
jgi:hypothetical protein